MAKREIRTIGDDLLRKKSREETGFDHRLHTLLDDMAETLYEANGVGLAAPQVGVLRRVVVIDMQENEEKQLIELVNPEIIEAEGEVEATEGCFSVPGRQGFVVRPERVKVRAQDRHGEPFELEGEGYFARCICHELDHLDGQLYVDIMTEEYFPEQEDDPEKGEKQI